MQTLFFWISCDCGNYRGSQILQLVKICLLLFCHSSLYSSFWYCEPILLGGGFQACCSFNPPTPVSGISSIRVLSLASRRQLRIMALVCNLEVAMVSWTPLIKNCKRFPMFAIRAFVTLRELEASSLRLLSIAVGKTLHKHRLRKKGFI